MSTVLTKEQLRSLKGQDVKTKDVPVSEWGENAVVRLSVLSGEKGEELQEMFQRSREQTQNEDDQSQAASAVLNEGLIWAVLSRSIVDGDNNYLFASDDEAKEILGPLNYETIMNLTLEALELNNMRGDSVEQAEKNSSTARSEDTGTGSPGSGAGASRKRKQK